MSIRQGCKQEIYWSDSKSAVVAVVDDLTSPQAGGRDPSKLPEALETARLRFIQP